MNVPSTLLLSLGLLFCSAIPVQLTTLVVPDLRGPRVALLDVPAGMPWRAVRWLASPAVARADEDTASLVRRGIELRRRGDDEAAVELFWQAWAIDPQPRSCAQLALAEQAVGSFVEAERHLLQALAVEADPWIVRHRENLEFALATIRSRLGSLVIRGGVVGAEVRVDGALVGELPLPAPIRLPAGRFRIDVSADTYYPVTRFVAVVPEQVVSETLVLVPDPSFGDRTRGDSATSRRGGAEPSARTRLDPTDAAPGESRHDRRVRRRRSGGAIIGIGAALLVSSAISFGIRERAARDFNAEVCLVGEATRGESCGDAQRRAIRSERASLATLVGGAAFTTTGAVLLVLAPRADSDADSSSEPGAVADPDSDANADGHVDGEADRRRGDADPGDSARAARLASSRTACAPRVGAVWGGECAWTF